MRHASGQLADGFELLGLEERFPRLQQSALRFNALADVASNLGKAHEGPGLIADCIDDHVGKESRAVLAGPPALLFKVPDAGCLLQASLRKTGTAILFRVKFRKML